MYLDVNVVGRSDHYKTLILMDKSTQHSLVSAGEYIDKISDMQNGSRCGDHQAALNEVSGDSKLCPKVQVSELFNECIS